MNLHLDARQRRAALALGYSFALGGTVFGSWASRLAEIKERLDASAGLLGAAMLCTAAGSVLALTLGPGLIRRIGTSRSIVLGGIGICVFVVAAVLAPTVVVLAPALLGLGLGGGFMGLAFGIQAIEFERWVGRPIMSRFHGCHSGGGLVGALLGAALSAHIAPQAHLVAVAALGLVGLAAVAPWLMPTEPQPDRAAVVTTVNRRLLVISAVAWAAAFAEGSVTAWAAVHIHEEIGASSGVAALGFAAQAAAMVIVRASGPAVLARWSVPATLRATGWVTAAGAALIAVAPAAAIAVVGCLFVGVGVALVFPAATATADTTQVDAFRGPRVRNDAFAVAVLLGMTGALLSGPILGALAALGGTRVGFACVALGGLAIAALSPRLAPQRLPGRVDVMAVEPDLPVAVAAGS